MKNTFVLTLVIFSLGPYCIQGLILHLNVFTGTQVLSSQQTPFQAQLTIDKLVPTECLMMKRSAHLFLLKVRQT